MEFMATAPTFAEVPIPEGAGDKPEKAVRPALRNALNLLRVYGKLIFPCGSRPHVDVVGRVQIGHAVGLSFEPATDNLSITFNRVGAMMNFRLAAPHVAEFHRHGFGHATKILHPVPTDGLLKKLADAVGWFADGMYEENPDSRLTKYMIAAECLLASGQRNENRTHMARRAAVLSTQNPKDRKAVRKAFCELYNERSRLFHGGASTQDEDWASTAEQIIFGSIISFIMNHEREGWSTFREFDLWQDGQARAACRRKSPSHQQRGG